MRLISIVAMFMAAATAAQENQTITLYDDFNKTGKSLVVNTSIPDLTDPEFRFNNKAKSVCGSGIWILYMYTNYRTFQDRPETNGELVVLVNGECYNLKNAPEKVYSVRYAGLLQDANEPSLNLYKGTGYGFSHVIVTDDNITKIDRNYESAIVTGSAQWTIGYQDDDNCTSGYDTINRKYICLIPAVEDNRQILATSDMSKSPYNVKSNCIKSVKQGCEGVENVLIVMVENRCVNPIGGLVAPLKSASSSFHCTNINQQRIFYLVFNFLFVFLIVALI